ncbi:MAG: D-aminoacyl-tRNA deacylase, partial [Phycisphaeraceae bacterium]
SWASVSVDGTVRGEIDEGLLVYLGVFAGDGEAEATWMAAKLPAMRLFSDEQGKMNRSTAEVGGGILLIPNFTLAGRTRKGTRPSFTDAADPAVAQPLFEAVAQQCGQQVRTATGVFGAKMQIDARFEGPVTVVVETPG